MLELIARFERTTDDLLCKLAQRRPLLDDDVDAGLLLQLRHALGALASDDARDALEAARAQLLDQVGAEDGRRDGEVDVLVEHDDIDDALLGQRAQLGVDQAEGDVGKGALLLDRGADGARVAHVGVQVPLDEYLQHHARYFLVVNRGADQLGFGAERRR
eukprot:6211888-Pleurochrysis_carterae.AAC.2